MIRRFLIATLLTGAAFLLVPAAQAATPRFQIRCVAGHVAQEDPIVAPGTMSGHMRQFFGNATTNVLHDDLRKLDIRQIAIRGRKLGKLRRTYWDVAPGKPLALIGSSGLLEIAVRDGSAADDLKIRVGDEVRVE